MLGFLGLEPVYNVMAPMLKVKVEVISKSMNCYILCNLYSEAYLIFDQEYLVGSLLFPPFSLNPMETKEIVSYLPLSIDVNSAIFEKLKTLSTDVLKFKFKFKGLVSFKVSTPASEIISEHKIFLESGRPNVEKAVREATMYVEVWRKLISHCYRNITWVALSRDVYLKLKKLCDETGYTFDELIDRLIEAWRRERRT